MCARDLGWIKPGQLGFINPGAELFSSHQIAGSAGHKNHFWVRLDNKNTDSNCLTIKKGAIRVLDSRTKAIHTYI